MDVWEIIRRSALNEGMAPEEREAVLQLCSDRTSELAELRSAAENACAERDLLAAELGTVKRTAEIRALAEKHNFTDPEYLDFLLKKRNVPMDDPGAAEAAMAGLKNECPRFFKVDIQPGHAGNFKGPEAAEKAPGSDLAAMVSNAPEAGF